VHTAYVGLGANLGDRRQMLCAAVALLARDPDVQLRRCSPVYESEPLGPIQQQPLFLNAVCEIATPLVPRTLLERLLAIEVALGRKRLVPQGPRLIDLDLLLVDDLVIDEPGLALPHPRLHERAFVLVPLCALAPDLVHPVQLQSVRGLRARIGDAGVRPFAPPDALCPPSPAPS
jgi:2-amino-4-hydroxy-6-hydroxymethyldihydropteridine diphosphokinase